MHNEHLALDRVRQRGGRPLSIAPREPGALSAQRLGRIRHALIELRLEIEDLEGTIESYSHILDTVQGRESIMAVSNECRKLILRPKLQEFVDVLADQLESVSRSEA